MNPESDSLTAEDSAKETALIDELTYKNTERMETFFSKIVYVDAENNLVFTVNPHWLNSKEIDQGLLLYEVSLKPVDGEAELVVADTELLPGETTTAAVKVSGKTLLNSFVDEYTLSANPTIEIDELGNIKATAVGATTITAMVGENKYEATVTVTEPAPAVTPDYDAAFGEDTYTTPDEKVNINPTVKVAAYAKDTTLSQTETTATKSGDIYEVKTPEEIGDYTFRYWARGLETGNRRIVSLENNFNYSAQNGDANWLIAVYAKDGEASEPEYFNANGQLLTKADENTKPYMLGYGYATDWKDNGNGIKEAVYDESKIEKYEITVNGKADTYTYGTEIKCPTVTAPENQYFWGWTKKVGNGAAELVSTDMNYTFYAWENCEVVPKFCDSELVRGDIIARKILISSLDIGNGESVIKAEFIGFDNAVERGITLDKDYAMTRNDAKQFAIINDVQEESISAYAILADGTKFIYTLNK